MILQRGRQPAAWTLAAVRDLVHRTRALTTVAGDRDAAVPPESRQPEAAS